MKTKLVHIRSIAILIVILFSACNSNTKQDTMEDKEITVTGIAQNGKAGALVLINSGETYYIGGLASWDDSIIGKNVKVTGIIQTETFKEEDLKDETGAWKQGMIGDKLTILKPEWKVVED